MSAFFALGVDLAGPANPGATAAAGLELRGEAARLVFLREGLDDDAIDALVREEIPAADRLTVGLDAPLSYNPGGGDRPGDRELRGALVTAGLAPGTVMAPTMTRMVYLALRGVTVARRLAAGRPDCRIVEVHPAGAMILRGAPVTAVRGMKRSATHRATLRDWLGAVGLAGLPDRAPGDHALAACAAALAAADWSRGRACWLRPAAPPAHPYDYAC